MLAIKELRSRLSASVALVLAGILLIAVASAVAASVAYIGWKLPLVAFLSVVGTAALAGPLVRGWYERERDRVDEQPYSWTVLIAIVAAFLVLAFYGATARAPFDKTVELLLIAAAATIVGVLVGFLFGVPRVATKALTSEEREGAATNLVTNTNLEEISDWLTKIIVGVSLVQADEIVKRFDILLDNLAGQGLPKALMGGVIIFFLVAGLINGYLWTRLILARYFSVSERALRERPEFYEGLMNAFLYQPKPEGYRRVLRLFEQYLRRFGEPGHSRVWVYVAAAYGQQYAWMRGVEGKPAESPDLHEVVNNAVEAIRRALVLDSGSRGLLQDLARGGYDDDLLMIAEEQPEVMEALHREVQAR